MISPRTVSGRLLLWSTRDSTGSWDPVGAGSPLLPALPGAGSKIGVAACGSLLGAGVSRLHFPRGRRVALTDLSKVTNDEPSCSVSEEEGELGVFCRSEVRNFGVRVEQADVRWVGARRKKSIQVLGGCAGVGSAF